tara:strand:+ start:170974 stop:172131 length:1158 start_codon:yes stop_codon:yes gene_type:complete
VGTAALLCVGVGCKKDEAKSDDKAATEVAPKATDIKADPIKTAATEVATTPTESAPTEPAPTASAISKGLAEEGNNPKLVELVAAFETCKLSAKNLTYECRDAVKPFNAAVDKVADVPTLFNFLDDPKPHVRVAAAIAISNFMLMQKAEGREFGDRLVAVAARETEASVASLLGPSILQGDFKNAEYLAAVKSLAETHALEEMRAGVIDNLPVQDWDTFFPFLKERLAKDKSPMVREAIMSSFYTSASKAGACDFFAENLADADAKVAAKAAYNIVWTSDACMAKYDDFLAEFDARVKASKANFSYLNSTMYFAQTEKSTDEQKAKFFGMLKTIVEDTSLGGMDRSSALKTIGKYDPEGKKYAKKFTGDSERFLADEAKRIVSGK